MSANLKQRLKNGERIVGTMINRIDTLDIVPMMKACGMDYIMLDNEHGLWDPGKVADITLMCNALDLGIFARIPMIHRPYIQQYLDCGMDGVMLPDCRNAEMAKEFLGHCKYAPEGHRGISVMRGHCGYNAVPDSLEFMKQKNEDTIVIIQIESREGLENVDEIMAIPGIDVALIGPNDFSSSLGIMGQYDNPIYVEGTKKVVAGCEASGKWAAIQAMDPARMRQYMERGFKFMMYGNEVTLLMNAAKQGVKDFKEIDASL